MTDDFSENNESKENERENERGTTSNGNPLFQGNEGKRFSSENQPSSEARSIGAKRRWTLKSILNQSVSGTFDGSKKDYRALAAAHLGIPEDEVTIRNVMEFRQIEMAIKKGDTKAFNAVLDRTDGKARQAPDDAPPPPVTTDTDIQKSIIDLGGGISFEI